MTEIIIKILLSIGLPVLAIYIWYKIGHEAGYSKREEQFQSNPITYNVGNEAACWIGREGGVVKIKIYNSKLVKIDK